MLPRPIAPGGHFACPISALCSGRARWRSIGASADAESLRGRILNVMKGHAFAGKLYPVSRSSAEVMGLRPTPPSPICPSRADLAVIIIPAKHIAEELERCGKAGVRAAIVLSSGFAEGGGRATARACRPRSAPSPSATTWR